MDSNLNSRKINKNIILASWLTFGLFFLLAGLYILPSRNAYKTIFYLSFLLPSIVVMVINFKVLFHSYFRGSTLFFIVFLFYLAVSSYWGNPDLIQNNIKRVFITIIASYGAFWLYFHHKKYFIRGCVAALIAAALISFFWMVDYYIISGRSLSSRFRTGGSDHFNLYEKRQYGGFYNPLLLSHTITFFLMLAMSLFFSIEHKSKKLSIILVLCSLVMSLLLIGAQTRMAWVVVVTVITALVLSRSGIKVIVLFLLGLSFCVFLFLQIDHSVVNRGFSLRPEIWLSTLNMMPDFWLLGHGLGAHLEIVVEGMTKHWSDTHNIYLEILFYSGIVGLLLLLAFMLKVAQELKLDLKTSAWCLIWCVYIALSGMTDGGGLLARPNEQWFKLVIPIMFILMYCREKDLVNNKEEKL